MVVINHFSTVWNISWLISQDISGYLHRYLRISRDIIDHTPQWFKYFMIENISMIEKYFNDWKYFKTWALNPSKVQGRMREFCLIAPYIQQCAPGYPRVPQGTPGYLGISYINNTVFIDIFQFFLNHWGDNIPRYPEISRDTPRYNIPRYPEI